MVHLSINYLCQVASSNRGVIDRKRPDQAGRAGRPLQSPQQRRNASRQLVRAGGSQPGTAKHSCAQRCRSALDSETAWCSCLQRREQLDKRADHPGEVRSSTAHSEGLGRSPPVPWWVRAKAGTSRPRGVGRRRSHGTRSAFVNSCAHIRVTHFLTALTPAPPHLQTPYQPPLPHRYRVNLCHG